MMQAIIFILFITLGIGLPLTLLIAPKHNPAGRLGLSYLLGIGIFTLLMYLTNLLGFKLIFLNNILIFLALSVPLTLFEARKLKTFWKEAKQSIKNYHPDWVEKITLGAIAFLVISSFVSTLFWPVSGWDALTLYDFRGHVFAQSGFIKSALETLGNSFYYSYPLLTTLSHTVVYLVGGANPQFLYSMFYLSLALVFYGQLREVVSQKLSLIFTLILITAPRMFEQSIISYTNLPYMAYFSLGVIYFYLWDRKRSPRYLILAGILTGLATWTRAVEPFWLGIFAIIISISLYRKRFLDPVIFAIFFFPIQQVWKNLQSSFGQGSSTVNEVTSTASVLPNLFNFGKWGEILSYLYGNIFKLWGPLFVLFIAASFFSIITKEGQKSFLTVFISCGLLAFFIVGTFIFSIQVGWYGAISDSAARVSVIFYPIFVYTIALVISPVKRNEK